VTKASRLRRVVDQQGGENATEKNCQSQQPQGATSPAGNPICSGIVETRGSKARGKDHQASHQQQMGKWIAVAIWSVGIAPIATRAVAATIAMPDRSILNPGMRPSAMPT
jgi:hypothetical protein